VITQLILVLDSRAQSLVRVACRERELEEVVVVKVGGYLSKRALSFRTLFEMFKSVTVGLFTDCVESINFEC